MFRQIPAFYAIKGAALTVTVRETLLITTPEAQGRAANTHSPLRCVCVCVCVYTTIILWALRVSFWVCVCVYKTTLVLGLCECV
jgi:hypothetical protein